MKYDERNQLIGFEARRGGTLLKKVSFRYDAFNRRVATFADTDGDASDDIVTYHIYGGQAAWQLVEEYPGAEPTPDLDGFDESAVRSYVYGLYIDEVVSMRDHASDDDFFYHQDDLFSVYALTDGDGVVVERYDYGDYGQVSIMAGDGTPRAESQYDNRHAFTGRLLMPELTLDDGSQILEYRHRYMHTASGRFVQRDPLGYIDTPNAYVLVSVRPSNKTDPLGLISTRPNLAAVCGLDVYDIIDVLAPAVKLIPSLPYVWPRYDSMPFQHFVWSCRESHDRGREPAEESGHNKEMLDKAICMLYYRLNPVCQYMLQRSNSQLYQFLVAHCRSAEQPTDYRDNEVGYQCGESLRRNACMSKPDCEDCCTANGIGPNTGDGPANDRPWGPWSIRPIRLRVMTS